MSRATVFALFLAPGLLASRPAGEERFEHPPGFRVTAAWSGPDPYLALAAIDAARVAVAVEGGGILELVDRDGDGVFDEQRAFTQAVLHCRGLAWHSGALLCVGVGPAGSGLYRVKRDAPDAPELLARFEGEAGSGAERGPTAVVPGPDGWLYLAIGGHAWLSEPPSAASPYRIVYEGHLLPPYVDPRSEPADGAAPGGVVARVAPDGGAVELFAGGLHDAHDLAFTLAGDLFTLDADEESGRGLPWYREARLLHLVPGGEYGWRAGSAQWPDWYPDALPPACAVGSVSPSGLITYTGTNFPTRYRGAFLAGDRARGRVLAFHLEPDGTTYAARMEELLVGRPLAVTDLAQAPDGSVLIATGGPDAEGALWRLAFEGDRADGLTTWRRAQPWPAFEEGVPIAKPFRMVASRDRFRRFAAARALEDRGIRAADLELVSEPAWVAEGLVAAARVGFARTDAEDCRIGIERAAVLASSEEDETLHVALRALGLFLQDEDATADLGELGAALLARFPTGDGRADGELALLLARLAPEGAVDALAKALADEPSRTGRLQLAYALRAVDRGWTDSARDSVLAWLTSDDARSGEDGLLRALRRDLEPLLGAERVERLRAADEAQDPSEGRAEQRGSSSDG